MTLVEDHMPDTGPESREKRQYYVRRQVMEAKLKDLRRAVDLFKVS